MYLRASNKVMQNPADARELLTADDVAQYFGLRPTTIYQWCREGRLPCMKLGKEWRVRRSALETFLEQNERRTSLVGQLQAFLTVPDDVLGIAETMQHLHRLDAAYFQVGETRGAQLIKFTGGDETPDDALRADLEHYGLAVRRLEAVGRMPFIPERDPFAGRADAPRDLVRTEAGEGRTLFVSFNWASRVDLNTVLRQQKAISEEVNAQQLVVKSALLQAVTDDWSLAEQRHAKDVHAGVIWLNERGLGLRRIVPLPPA